jgi:hypothetical protein
LEESFLASTLRAFLVCETFFAGRGWEVSNRQGEPTPTLVGSPFWMKPFNGIEYGYLLWRYLLSLKKIIFESHPWVVDDIVSSSIV